MEWPIPEMVSINGIYKGQFLFSLQQDWTPEGQGEFKAGDLVAFELDAFLKTRTLPPVSLVFRPSATQAVDGVAVAKGAALLAISDNVIGKVLRLSPSASGWTTTPVELPGTGQVGIAFADSEETAVFLNYEDFLTPSSLLNYEITSGAVTPLKSLPAKFDTAGLKVEQFFAPSKDGTKVPYFIIHREDIKLDGTTPTLLYGYGGFQVSMNPGYSPVI